MSAGRDTALEGPDGAARGLERAWTQGAPLVFVLLWASGFVLAKFITPHADPMTFLAIRFSLAAAVLVAIAVATGARWPTRRQARDQAIVGLSMHTAYIGGVFVAIDQGLPAGVASLIVGLQPLLSAFVVGPLLGERVSRLQWAGLVLGLVGVALVLESKLELDGATVGAVGLAVLALVGTTGATLYQKRFGSATDLRTGTAVQYVAGAVGCAVAGAFEERPVRRERRAARRSRAPS
ncbi:MAG: EamA family transporter [Thermoleophilia bacterium]